MDGADVDIKELEETKDELVIVLSQENTVREKLEIIATYS